jgi:hypothetical protein
MLIFNRGTRLHFRPLRLHLRNEAAGGVSARIADDALSCFNCASSHALVQWRAVFGWRLASFETVLRAFQRTRSRDCFHMLDEAMPSSRSATCHYARAFRKEGSSQHAAIHARRFFLGSSPTVPTSRRSTASIGTRMSKIIRSTRVSRGQ